MYVLRPLSTGQLLDQIFLLYRRHFFLFCSIALFAQIGALVEFAALKQPEQFASPGKALALTILTKFTTLVFTAIADAATVIAVSDLYLNRPASTGASFRRVLPITGRLVGLSIGLGFIVGIGFVLLIIPGIYWAINYSLSTAAMTIEDGGFSESLARSKELVDGNRWRVVLVFLMGIAVLFGLAFLIALPVEYAVTHFTPHPALTIVLEILNEIIAPTLAMPLALIGFTLIYYDARVRKEAFDIQYLVDSEVTGAGSAATSSS